MFQCLRKSDDASVFRQLAHRFLSRKEINQTVLCFDHYFVKFPSTLEITNADMVDILKDFRQYCCSFHDLILGLDLSDKNTQKLFDFRPASTGNTYRIKTKTWLYRRVIAKDATAKPIVKKEGESIVVSSIELRRFLKAVLSRHISVCVLHHLRPRVGLVGLHLLRYALCMFIFQSLDRHFNC